MKKILLLLLLLSGCRQEEICYQPIVEVYKIQPSFDKCKYYIYAIPPQLPLTDSIYVKRCDVYKVGDRFLLPCD